MSTLPFYALIVLALVGCTYQAAVQLSATNTEQEYMVNSCDEATCTYEITAASLNAGEYVQAYFPLLAVSDSLPSCTHRSVKISKKVGSTYHEITELCSGNLDSEISKVKFVSFDNGIKLEYTGQVNNDGFVVKYKKKSGLTNICERNFPRTQKSGTFRIHDSSEESCSLKINIQESKAIKIFTMDMSLPAPTSPHLCKTSTAKEIFKVSVQNGSRLDVANSCVGNVQNWCGVGIPAVFSTAAKSVKLAIQRNGRDGASFKGFTAGFVTYIPANEEQNTECYIPDNV